MRVLGPLALRLHGCADLPERLDGIAHAARAALHRRQHLGLVCNPHCRITSYPAPAASPGTDARN